MNYHIYLFGSLILVTLSQLLFKKGVMATEKQGLAIVLDILAQKEVILGLLLNGLAAVLWLLALSGLELSYIFPFLSLNYILVPVLAFLFLKEKLSRLRVIGICSICIGLLFIAMS